MLDEQEYDGHASIDDDATARIGPPRRPDRGPDPLSLFPPLPTDLGPRLVRARLRSRTIETWCRGRGGAGHPPKRAAGQDPGGDPELKRDGTQVLRGTASVGDDGVVTALEQRLTELKPLTDPVILRDIQLGMRSRRQAVRMAFNQNMGELYPFSLRQKLAVITEPRRCIPVETIHADVRSSRWRC